MSGGAAPQAYRQGCAEMERIASRLRIAHSKRMRRSTLKQLACRTLHPASRMQCIFEHDAVAIRRMR
jgi:hypothetical protein